MKTPYQIPMGQSLRPRAAAHRLGIGLATFWRYSKRPDFPRPRRLSPRCTVFDEDELMKWRDEQGKSS